MRDAIPSQTLTARWPVVPRAKAVLGAIGWMVASGPVALLVFLLLHAIHVRLYLGRWPVVYRDEPQSLLLSIHEYGLIAPTFYLCLFGVPTWLLGWTVLLACRLAPAKRFTWQLAFIVVGLLGMVLLATYDPTGYMEWFVD
jgi:hypothetical protein